MFQTFYDEIDDRWFLIPLRNASSHTDRLARTLNFKEFNDIDDFDKDQYRHSTNAQILHLLSEERFKNSEIVTVIRDPFTRYISGLSMIFPQKFGAPGVVPASDIATAKKQEYGSWLGVESPYSYVDKQIESSQRGNLFFDFAFNDNHMVPMAVFQLLLLIIKPNTNIINLADYDDYLISKYPPGHRSLQNDFWTLSSNKNIMGYSKRSNSQDMPKHAALSIYERFLAPLPWYNPGKAARLGLKHTFHDYLSYDKTSYDILRNYDRNFALSSLEKMFNNPYFYIRDRRLYRDLLNTATLLPQSLQLRLFQKIPEVQQYAISNSWLNTSNFLSNEF